MVGSDEDGMSGGQRCFEALDVADFVVDDAFLAAEVVLEKSQVPEELRPETAA
jgi:hypothetical protein